MTNSMKSEEEHSPKKKNVEDEVVDSYSQGSIERRSGIDRRSGMDRRQTHDLDRHIDAETQRRNIKERRENDELRSGWVRFSKWSSVFVGGSNLKGAKATEPIRHAGKGDEADRNPTEDSHSHYRETREISE